MGVSGNLTKFDWKINDFKHRAVMIEDVKRDDKIQIESEPFFLTGSSALFELVYRTVRGYNNSRYYIELRPKHIDSPINLCYKIYLKNKLLHKIGSNIGLDPSRNLFKHWVDPKLILNQSDGCVNNDTLHIYCEVFHADIQSGSDKFRQKLMSLAENGSIDKCTFQVGEKSFTVPKISLMAISPVFERMLQSDSIETTTGIIQIKDSSVQVMENFVEYINSGQIKIENEFVEDLFYIADKYEIPELKSECGVFLGQTLDKSNALSRLKLAFMHNDDPLKQYTLNFVADKFAKGIFMQIMLSEEWIKLGSSQKELYDEIVKAVFARFQKL